MSVQSENIEQVKRLYQAFRNPDMSAILELLSADVEWGKPANPLNPAGGTRNGHAGFLEWARIGRESENILVLQPRKMLTPRLRVRHSADSQRNP